MKILISAVTVLMMAFSSFTGLSDVHFAAFHSAVPQDHVALSTLATPAEDASYTPSLQTDFSKLYPISNKFLYWGQGTIMDPENRPEGSIKAQSAYGKYGADFIRENTKNLYLTLDEGYENGYTSKILDVLKEKDCPAVFFVTMPYVKANPALIQRMIDEGHVVGAHSVTHPEKGMPSLSLEKQAEEIRKLHAYVKDTFDYDMYLFRYPAGIYSEQSLALVQQMGYRSVFWSFAYRDWITDDQPEPAAALKKLETRLHPGAIYLLHAVSKTNTDILGEFIDQTRAKGYTFAKYAPEQQ